MSITRAGIVSAVVLGGATLFGKYVMPQEKPFAEYDQTEFRLLEKYDTKEPKDWISDNEARTIIFAEFDANQDGQITGEEQPKAVSFLANVYKENSFIPATPFNVGQARLKLLGAMYDMSPNAADVHTNLTNEIARLRQE